MDIYGTPIIGGSDFVGIGKNRIFPRCTLFCPGHVIDAQNDILSRHNTGTAICRGKDIVAGKHQYTGFGLGFYRKGDVNCHLIAIEIRIECFAHQWVQLQGLSFNKDGFKRLNTQPMEGGRTIQQNRILLHHFIQGIPYLGYLLFHHLLSTLNRRNEALLFQFIVYKRFEEF